MRQSGAGDFLSRATRPTLSDPCDSRFPLCVGLLRDSTAFSLVHTLPSTTSAEANTSLFGGFTGTMVQSDSSAACMSGLRLSPSRTGLLAQTPRRPPGSRACCFSTCMGSPTTPGRRPTRDLTPVLRVGFPSSEQGRRPEVRLRSSIPSPPMPLSTLRQPPRDDPRKTRGQDGFATPFLWGSFIPDNMPVYPGALNLRPSCLAIPVLWAGSGAQEADSRSTDDGFRSRSSAV